MTQYEVVDQYGEWWGDFKTIDEAKAEIKSLVEYVGYVFHIENVAETKKEKNV